jgi:hypothetical protein
VLPCREQVTGQYSNAKYAQKLRSLAEPFGFHVIDPLPGLRDGSDVRTLFIPYDRNHPSAAGHQLIAQEIIRHLVALGLFGPQSERATPASPNPPTTKH